MMRFAGAASRVAWFRLSVVLASSLLALGVCEAGLRVFWDRPSTSLRLSGPSLWVTDAELGWRPRPNFKSVLEVSRRHSVTVSTNSRGFRDEEHSVERRSGVKRLLILGDSFAFGWGVEAGESFVDRLRPKLPQVEVINLGVPAWNLKQYRKILEREGLAYRPDVVLVALFQNDLSPASIPGLPLPLRTRLMAWARLSDTYELFRSAIINDRRLYRVLASTGLLAPPGGFEQLDDNLRPALVTYPDAMVRDWNAALEELAAIKRDCDARGASLLIAAIPARQALEQKALLATLTRSRYEPQDFDLEKPYRELEGFCRRLGIPYVNGWAVLRAVDANLYISGDLHFSAMGHLEFARILVDPVTRLLDAQSSLITAFQN